MELHVIYTDMCVKQGSENLPLSYYALCCLVFNTACCFLQLLLTVPGVCANPKCDQVVCFIFQLSYHSPLHSSIPILSNPVGLSL